VTLTRQTLDVTRHLPSPDDEMGFWEVGFAPVTTAPGAATRSRTTASTIMLEQFRALARTSTSRRRSRESAPRLLERARDAAGDPQGARKAYPCGAGMGLMGVATDGDVALCHRFAGSDDHKLGSCTTASIAGDAAAFLESHHINDKTDCRTCWARPICAGGCYHEAHTRYGDTAPNLHYCEWIRGWTHTCLEIYGELAGEESRLSPFDQFRRNGVS
jgi:uncharacterized protein